MFKVQEKKYQRYSFWPTCHCSQEMDTLYLVLDKKKVFKKDKSSVKKY